MHIDRSLRNCLLFLTARPMYAAFLPFLSPTGTFRFNLNLKNGYEYDCVYAYCGTDKASSVFRVKQSWWRTRSSYVQQDVHCWSAQQSLLCPRLMTCCNVCFADESQCKSPFDAQMTAMAGRKHPTILRVWAQVVQCRPECPRVLPYRENQMTNFRPASEYSRVLRNVPPHPPHIYSLTASAGFKPTSS